MLGIQLRPTGPRGYDPITALQKPAGASVIVPEPIALPEPTIEPTGDLEVLSIGTGCPTCDSPGCPGCEDKPVKAVKYKGDHSSLSNEEFQGLIAQVKAMSLDPNLHDAIRRHMLDFMGDLQDEFAERANTEAEAAKKDTE